MDGVYGDGRAVEQRGLVEADVRREEEQVGGRREAELSEAAAAHDAQMLEPSA